MKEVHSAGRERPQSSLADLDLGKYYHLFFRYLWLICVIVGIVMLVTAAWVMRQPKIYESRAVLQVEQSEQNVIKVDDVQAEKLDSLDYVKTLEQSLANNVVLLKVIKDSGLDKDPSFVKQLPYGQSYSDLDLAGRLAQKVTVKQQRGTRLITVSVSDQSPERAKQLTELIVKEFLRQTIEQRLTISRIANDFLSEEGLKLKKKLEESQQKLQQYREKHNAVSLEQNQNIIIDKLRDISAKTTEAKGKRLSLEADLEQLRKLPPDDIDSLLQIGTVSAIPDVVTIRTQIFKSEAELAAVQKRYLPKHPKYLEAVSQLERHQRSLRDTLQNAGDILQRQYQSAQSTENKMNEVLAEQEKAALELNKIAIPYGVLASEVESDQAMYQSVITRQRETTLTQFVEKSPFRIVEAPMIPSRPSAPRPMKTLAIASIFAFGLAIFLVLGLDILDSTIRSLDAGEAALNIRAIAVVPELKKAGDGRIIDVFSSDSGGSGAEAFRTLRTSLSLLGDEGGRKSFLVTSSIPGEGKSFTALNTAIAFASEGHKTLLIDADLRRPSLQKIFAEGNAEAKKVGLVDYLAGNSTQESIIQNTPQSNLSVILSGNRAPNPADLLSNSRLETLLKDSLLRFDRVVIDSAPMNAVSDTQRIVSLVDYTCLVIRAGKTPKRAIVRARNLIDRASGRIAGFILNRVSLGRGSSYYYYHYEYGDDEGAKSAKKA